jgi:hypothetical protein
MLEIYRALVVRGAPVRMATQGGPFECVLRDADVPYDLLGPRMDARRCATFVRSVPGIGPPRHRHTHWHDASKCSPTGQRARTQGAALHRCRRGRRASSAPRHHAGEPGHRATSSVRPAVSRTMVRVLYQRGGQNAFRPFAAARRDNAVRPQLRHLISPADSRAESIARRVAGRARGVRFLRRHLERASLQAPNVSLCRRRVAQRLRSAHHQHGELLALRQGRATMNGTGVDTQSRGKRRRPSQNRPACTALLINGVTPGYGCRRKREEVS